MAIINVTTSADSGAGSLRAAIASAQAGDTIKFASTLANKTITLTSGQLSITKNLTIDGTGTANLKISGNNATGVFLVERQIGATFKNLTIADGKTTGKGGAIQTYDYGSITVDNCKFTNNRGGTGGAIYLGYGGRSTVVNSSFDGNDGTSANSGWSGGAIATAGAGNLVVKDSIFTDNKGVNGGAIYSLLGTLTVENSVFEGNSSAGGMGGGAIFTDGATPVGPGSPIAGTITVRGSWFEDNHTEGEGGALFLYGYAKDQIVLEDSTIVGNSAGYNAQGVSRGGGVRATSDLTIKNVTIANNTAERQGGGLWIDRNSKVDIINSTFSGNKVTKDAGGAMFIDTDPASPINIVNSTIVNNFAGRASGAIMFGGNKNVTLTNSIVANNTAGNKYQQQVTTSLKDGGGNIEWPKPGYGDRRVVAGSRIVDPLIDTLQNIGGDLVHPLKTGSPAINTGIKNAIVPTIDQGSVLRDTQPDVGAYEVAAKRSPQPISAVNSEKFAIYGTMGNDVLTGTSGNDILMGGYGNDTLIGGGGIDILIGGGGDDRFAFQSFSDKGDYIIGFDRTKEAIDLSQIIDGSNFKSTNPFTDYIKLGQVGSNTVVSINPDGDSNPNQFQQFLTLRNITASSLTVNNFIL
ncbi:type I secretion C-terminal target domain-containing protein [Nostocaceae cyanobacterium CENA369]|uniref:Type I secretion C-terminal target domain-containing protein n=1 Tax=Dendronalium phyllosphericum CENA369 TaxID=1725256 RepID=A0A8J7LDD7_9NOST|nr:right-handed parallel beta-helix repeat-containing protein [Dendronalium phyllosphericum]MBH8571564.1 type I secretion C-terminal target domain-containing protein [Dendronalium phyllosphericum CENA369]